MNSSITAIGAPLEWTQLLDPRPMSTRRQTNAIVGAAHLPVETLFEVPFALPPKGSTIRICKVEGHKLALRILTNQYRTRQYSVSLTDEFAFGDTSHGYRLWSVPEILEEHVMNSVPGNALCLACGSGREAIFLQSAGWKVIAMDHLESAILMGKKFEQIYHRQAFEKIEWLHADVHDSTTHFNAIGQTFSLVTSLMYYHDGLEIEVTPLLSPSGTFILTGYTKAFQTSFGKPKKHDREKVATQFWARLVFSFDPNMGGCRYQSCP